MKAKHLIPMLCSVTVLSGCFTPAALPGPDAMRIEPLLSVRNSDSTARGYYQLGRYYQGQNRLEQAADAYRTALQLHSGYIDARSALGATYAQQGKFDEAIAEYSAILTMAPHLAHIFNNLGYTYLSQGNYPEAIAAFEKAITLDPRNPRTFNNLGSAYEKIGETANARMAFARALALNGGAETTEHHGPSATSPAVASAVPLPALHGDSGIRLDNTARSAEVALDAIPAAATALLEQTVPATQSLPPMAVPRDEIAGAPAALPAAKDFAPDWKDRPFHLEIANGNGVNGMAKKMGNTLTQAGVPAPRLTNLKPYRRQLTVVEYRTGFYDAALQLGGKLTTAPVVVSSNTLRANTDVRLVLGKDLVKL